MAGKILAALLFILCTNCQHVNAGDTLPHAATSDTAATALVDSNPIKRYAGIADSQQLLLSNNKVVVNDIEQMHQSEKSIWVFVLLVIMLAALTYLKTAFGKDIEELVQSVTNNNLAQQIFRTQSKEISFSTVVLNVNFIVVMSLYVRFVLVHYYHVSTPENFYAILFMNILFTFFYLGKIAVVRIIGVLFEAGDACEEYIFNFTIVCKTIGLTLLPALFIFYTAPVRFFNFVFIITVLIFACMLALLVWRGLSTVYKLLYRSVYHFFIYVCVVEISMIFLLFKLLTKTIT